MRPLEQIARLLCRHRGIRPDEPVQSGPVHGPRDSKPTWTFFQREAEEVLQSPVVWKSMEVLEAARDYVNSRNSMGRHDAQLLHKLENAIARFDTAFSEREVCGWCNGTGAVVVRSSDAKYLGSGPLSDDCRGRLEVSCPHCSPTSVDRL